MKASELKKGDCYTQDNAPENVWRVKCRNWRRGLKIEVEPVSGPLVDSCLKKYGKVPTSWQAVSPRTNVTLTDNKPSQSTKAI